MSVVGPKHLFNPAFGLVSHECSCETVICAPQRAGLFERSLVAFVMFCLYEMAPFKI